LDFWLFCRKMVFQKEQSLFISSYVLTLMLICLHNTTNIFVFWRFLHAQSLIISFLSFWRNICNPNYYFLNCAIKYGSIYLCLCQLGLFKTIWPLINYLKCFVVRKDLTQCSNNVFRQFFLPNLGPKLDSPLKFFVQFHLQSSWSDFHSFFAFLWNSEK